tara:strand:- start:79 stop:390 length:312 start_codon:yes stop_codon:yes gene_type:complete
VSGISSLGETAALKRAARLQTLQACEAGFWLRGQKVFFGKFDTALKRSIIFNEDLFDIGPLHMPFRQLTDLKSPDVARTLGADKYTAFLDEVATYDFGATSKT